MGVPLAASWQIGLVLILVQTSWAINGVLVKLAVDGGANPIVFAFWRDALAAPVLLLLANSQQFGPFRWPSGRYDALMFAAMGFTGVVGSQMLSPLALRYVEPHTFSLFQLLLPVITPFFATWFGLEEARGGTHSHSDWSRVAGLLICIAGAAADILSKAGVRGETVGFVLLIIQVTSGSAFQLLVRKMFISGLWPPTALTAWAYTVGTVQLTFALAVERPPTLWLEGHALFALGFAVLFASVFNYAAMSWANRQCGPTVVSAFFPLQVVVSTLIQPLAGLPGPTAMDWASVGVVSFGLAVFMLAEATNTSGDGELCVLSTKLRATGRYVEIASESGCSL